MSSVTGEIAYKVGAANMAVPRVLNAPLYSAAPTLTVIGASGLNGNVGPFALLVLSTNIGVQQNGVLVKAGSAATDFAFLLQNPTGTATFCELFGDGHGSIGWNNQSQPVLSWNNSGATVNNSSNFQLMNSLSSILYVTLSSGGVKITNASVGNPPMLQVMEAGSAATQQFGVANQFQTTLIGTSTSYAWGTGTHYPCLQFAGIGAILGTGTVGLVTMAGGLYYNGTNYIYGQAGTGIIETLGTGSYTISCVSTSGTAGGTATLTTVFSIGGTVTSNKIQGYGPTNAGLVDMTPDLNQPTLTFTGMTTVVTGVAVLSKQGNQVTCVLPAVTGTSNATSFTLTGLPTAFQPARSQIIALPSDFVDSGGAIIVSPAIQVTNSGTMTLFNAGTAANWGATLLKGFTASLTFTYLLN